MAFWSQANVEPKRNYKFRVQFASINTGAGAAGSGTSASSIIWWAKTVTLPSFDVSEVEHNYFDNKYYFPGRTTWNDVSLTLVDPVSVDAAGLTSKLLQDSGYQISSNEASKTKTINKIDATTATGDVIISVYADDGAQSAFRVVEKWTLKNAWVKSAKFGDLDYASDDFKMIELVLRYDWAQHEPDAANGGNEMFTQV